ncbi:MAG TPA: hypothetical protein VJ742_05510 [Nitrososphaera sp.]|nr:hypothetical protein [Nitrososphaera sp.]
MCSYDYNTITKAEIKEIIPVTVNGDLAAITGKVLSSLGEPTMQALFWELSSQGVTTNPEEFDIRKFDAEMKKIFGDGANVFMEEIYSQFKGQFEQRYGEHGNLPTSDEENLPAVEKIQRILSLKVMS